MSNEDAQQRQLHELPPKLRLGQVVPVFYLPDSSGKRISLWSFKGRRNLTLFFFHGSRCATCRDVLTAFALHYQEYRDLDAEVLAISRDPIAMQRALVEALRLPFPVLSDVRGDATARYTYLAPAAGTPVPSVFIADRYGALYYQTIAELDTELPTQEQILQWVLFIGIQCDECGVPEWPRS